MKHWFRAFPAVAFVLGSTLTAACAADTTASDPVAPVGSSESPETAAGTKLSAGTKPSVEELVRERKAQLAAASAHQCSQNACCLLATPPTGYPDDPLESSLTSLGCTLPSAYSDPVGGSGAWLYVQCPLSFNLLLDVARYAGAPYFARFSVNACLQPVTSFGKVVIEFDPTCDSCITNIGGGIGIGGGGGLPTQQD